MEDKRTRCTIYSRVVWFLVPVENFNHWKKAEFYSRKFFDLGVSLESANQKFNKQYLDS